MTRSRLELMRKGLPHWLEQNVNIKVTVDPSEWDETREALGEFLEVELVKIPIPKATRKHRRGEMKYSLGWLRNFCIKRAKAEGYKSVLLSDDDLYPTTGDIGELCRVVLDHNVVGCGCSTSYHGLLLGDNGNAILKTGEAFPIAGVYGHCFYALNINNALSVGGYLEKFKSGVEDSEIQRESIAAGMPWWLHTGVHYHSMAKRYSAGGLAAALRPEERKRQERLTHFYSFERWPDYVSDPNKSDRKVSCRWRKMMDDYIPDWRDDIPAEVVRLQNAKPGILTKSKSNPATKGSSKMANPYEGSGSTANNTKDRKEKARSQERCQLCWDKVPLKDQYTLENVDGVMVMKKNAARRGAEKLWHGDKECATKRQKVTQRGIEREAEKASGKAKPKKAKAAKAAPAKTAKAKAVKATKAKTAKKRVIKRKVKKAAAPKAEATAGSGAEPF
jgi:hypothetical protein